MDRMIRNSPSVVKNDGDTHHRAQPYPSSDQSGSGANAPMQNRLYAFQTRGDQESSPDVVTARVRNIDSKTPSIDLVPVVKEFPNLFPDDLHDFDKGGFMVHNGSEASFVSDEKPKQYLDLILVELKEANFLVTITTILVSVWPPLEALYGRRCRSPKGWFEVSLIGPELVHEAMNKVWLIKEWLRTAQNRQKSYADVRKRDLEFDSSDWFILNLTHEGCDEIWDKIGSYQFLRPVGKVSYELDLPNDLAMVHPMFHVTMLKKCLEDSTSVVPLEGLGVDESLSYEEASVEILDRQVKRLRKKEVP
ncbi:hypothetical protein MTR67_002477 [Solanum verrucosum]|uniref:Tf2-1-like SH3-like domain-containing protein n=1 Tax=Solanum verrucosum TaxID=315347 RepID=A0AAF0PR27_SOLVR|nr:hypothetical protein MTR67_002477 [Solanum verrucosum]